MKKYGYARVSTAKQDLEAQVALIESYGVDQTYIEAEVVSSRKEKRAALERVLAELSAGDELHVVELSRLGRNMEELASVGKQLEEKKVKLGIGGTIHDPSTFEGRAIFLVFAMVAELEREFIADRTRRRLAHMKAEGKPIGRKPALSKRQITEARKAYEAGYSKNRISKIYGVSRATVSRALEASQDEAAVEQSPELRKLIREQVAEDAAIQRKLEAAKKAADEAKERNNVNP